MSCIFQEEKFWQPNIRPTLESKRRGKQLPREPTCSTVQGASFLLVGQLDLAGHLLLNLKQLTAQEQASAAPRNAPFLQLKGERLEDTGPLVCCTQDLEGYRSIPS